MSKFCGSCGYEYEKKEAKCPECGASYLIAKASEQKVGDTTTHPIIQILFYQPKNRSDKYIVTGRYIVSAMLALFTFFVFLSGPDSSVVGFFHNVNLPFHEAGHVVFSLFQSSLLTSMGGTLLQFIVPFICFGTFLLQNRDPFAASVALWWFAENFVDIAPYIADARAGVLPLLGGNTGQTSPYGFHDWEYILGELGLSYLDTSIAYFSQIFGIILMIVSVVWGLYVLINLKKLS